ncbi:MAG TPA: wax ester/triacylglycerol synthase domain-containing protein [Mycobacteriales bacterium]|nr:wax ester/triacylglycerol synthase domain-containing protein [Mycobacteriales bacterium]
MARPRLPRRPAPEPAPELEPEPEPADRVLGPADAFFVYAESRRVPQTVVACAVADITMTRSALASYVVTRLGDMPWMRRRLVSRWLGLRRPAWRELSEIDLYWHVAEAAVPVPGGLPGLAAFTARIAGRRLPRDRPPWRMWVLPDIGPGRAGYVVAVHHAVCDGPALIELLGAMFDRPIHASGGRAAPVEPRSRRSRLLAGGRTARGVLQLAADGMVRAGPFTRRSSPARRLATGSVPLGTVRAAARAAQAQPTDVVLAALGGAIGQVLPDAIGERKVLRAAVPVLARTGAEATDTGNRTAALWVRVPLDQPDPVARLRTVAADRAAAASSNRPAGTRFVLERLFGVLPAPLHRLAVRFSYRGRFFHTIVSVMPGPRRIPTLGPAELYSAYPVLPMAPRVGLTLGGLVWGDALCLGLAGEPRAVPDAQALLAAILADIERMATAGRPGSPPTTAEPDDQSRAAGL